MQNNSSEREIARLNFVHTCVNVGMLFHVGLLVEPLRTVRTLVGPRVAVNEHVRGERARALETLGALLALEDLVLTVHGAVLRQTHRVAERLLTDVALERTSLDVVTASHVHFETV